MESKPGTYALILKSDKTTRIQIGRWGQLDLQSGYYIYVGSAFGPGGVKARVERHFRTGKRHHWHIDYLREHVTPLEVWISYSKERREHKWAGTFSKLLEMVSIPGFGCSDCKCYSHLFYTHTTPKRGWLDNVEVINMYNLDRHIKVLKRNTSA